MQASPSEPEVRPLFDFTTLRRAALTVLGMRSKVPLYEIIDETPYRCGPFADIFRGRAGGSEKVDVVVKVIRGARTGLPSFSPAQKAADIFIAQSETYLHENICPVIGLFYGCGPMPAIVQHYYSNGNINEYISKHPDVDKLGLIIDVGSALEYIHKLGLVHGNVGPENILINDSGRALLSDCGFSLLMRSPFDIPSSWHRWAPEALLPQNHSAVPQLTVQTDVHAFGLTVYEIYSGVSPYLRRPCYKGLIDIVSERLKVQKPPEIDAKLWSILERTWKHDPDTRLPMSVVLAELQDLAIELDQSAA